MLRYIHSLCTYNSYIKVDIAAQDIIKQTILEAFPHHTFMGEEDVPPGREASKLAIETYMKQPPDNFWICDPIDGLFAFYSYFTDNRSYCTCQMFCVCIVYYAVNITLYTRIHRMYRYHKLRSWHASVRRHTRIRITRRISIWPHTRPV